MAPPNTRRLPPTSSATNTLTGLAISAKVAASTAATWRTLYACGRELQGWADFVDLYLKDGSLFAFPGFVAALTQYAVDDHAVTLV